MQRRAAAIYVALFLVVGAASYSLIATASQPTVSFENPEYELSTNDTFQVPGSQQTYKVASISSSGGGEGGSASVSGSIEWVNQSARYTQTWENNSSVTFQQQSWTVLVPNQSNTNSFRLREEINRTKILQNDTNADNQTLSRNGTEYVVVTQNGTSRLVPASQYFPAPNTRTFNEGQQVNYNGNQTTFENVSAQSVRLAWTAPRTNTVEASDEGNVTVGGQTYLATFPDNKTLVLTQDFDSYQRQTEEIAEHREHVSGLWGVTILSGAIVVLLTAMAFLPSRY
jgi:hypothetical protein